jgi:ABC-type glycerol-3-phosphate transport system substrate-binding protein
MAEARLAQTSEVFQTSEVYQTLRGEKMNKKLICAMMLIATLLAACGKPASPTAVRDANLVAADDETGTTTLRFAIFDWGQYNSLIAAFESANPDVHIKTVDIEQVLGLESKDGWPADAAVLLASSADVIALPASRAAVQQETLLDLSPFIASDPNLAAEDFYPNLLESVQWDGGIWSLPTEAEYQMISYNKALFDAAGMAYPQPGWSWDDFLAAAQALTIREGERVAQWGFVQPWFDPVPFVQSRAGLLFDLQTQPPTANLDSPAVAEAVQWYADLFLVHQVAPHTTSLEEEDSWVNYKEGMQLIVDEQAAMWIGVVRGKEEQMENIGIAPFPTDDPDAATTPVTVQGLSISRGTNKADLAWQWVSFLGQQQVNTKRGFYPGYNVVPALPSAAAAGGFWDKLDTEMATALQYAVDHAYVDSYGEGAGYGAFYNAVVDVIQNDTPVETALANAQTVAENEIEAAVSAAPTPVPNLAVAEEEEAAIAAGATVIQFGMGANRFGQQSFQDMVARFQEEHPDVVVELEEPKVRGGPSLEEMARVYDCFQGMPNLNSDDAVAAVLNMDPFFAADPDVSPEDFFPSVMDQFTYQGQVWGLPGSVTVNVMNYNKDLFDAAGLDYPSAAWTTSDFAHLATTLTQGEGENKQYGYLPGYGEAEDLIVMIDRLGGDMYDDSVNPPRLVLNSPNVIEAVRWYTSLPGFSAHAGGAPLSEEERAALIGQGQVAIWSDPWGKLGEEKDLDVGVAPLPLGPHSAEGSGYESVDGYFISAETEARQACWNWIAFLTQQPTAWGLPACQEVAESNAYRQAVGDERADAYIASVSSGSGASFVQRLSDAKAWFRFAYAWLANAYDRIVAGDMSVEEAMNAAQEAADIHRDCAITNNALQPPDWDALGACYEEANAAVPDLAGE